MVRSSMVKTPIRPSGTFMKSPTIQGRVGALKWPVVPNHLGHSQPVISEEPVTSKGLNSTMLRSIAPVRHGRLVAEEADRNEASGLIHTLKSLYSFKTVHERE